LDFRGLNYPAFGISLRTLPLYITMVSKCLLLAAYWSWECIAAPTIQPRAYNGTCRKTSVAILYVYMREARSTCADPITKRRRRCWHHSSSMYLSHTCAFLEPDSTLQQALSNQSVSDFLIIEYNGEIGGRMAHTNFGKDADGKPYLIELGANWVRPRALSQCSQKC